MPQQYSVVQFGFPEPGFFISRREDLHSDIFSLPLPPPDLSVSALSWGRKHTELSANDRTGRTGAAHRMETRQLWPKYPQTPSDHPRVHLSPLHSHTKRTMTIRKSKQTSPRISYSTVSDKEQLQSLRARTLGFKAGVNICTSQWTQ